MLFLNILENTFLSVKNYIVASCCGRIFWRVSKVVLFRLQLSRLRLVVDEKISHENKGVWISKKLGGIYFSRTTHAFYVISTRIGCLWPQNPKNYENCFLNISRQLASLQKTYLTYKMKSIKFETIWPGLIFHSSNLGLLKRLELNKYYIELLLYISFSKFFKNFPK